MHRTTISPSANGEYPRSAPMHDSQILVRTARLGETTMRTAGLLNIFDAPGVIIIGQYKAIIMDFFDFFRFFSENLRAIF